MVNIWGHGKKIEDEMIEYDCAWLHVLWGAIVPATFVYSRVSCEPGLIWRFTLRGISRVDEKLKKKPMRQVKEKKIE